MTKQLLKFVTWPAIAGVLIALLILERLPGSPLFDNQRHSEPASYAPAVNVATPSVVNIHTSKVVQSRRNRLLEDPFFRRFLPSGRRQQERIQRSLGSGVVVSTDGHILTNNHVIAGADEILVSLYDGRESLAHPIGSDPETDLAVLKIDLPDIEPARIANSDHLQVGDVVLAIGNPFGYSHSVSQGIISALGRYGLQAATYENYIQTDAAINPGNSGGALINTQGQLLGINTLVVGSTGIGFAIPSNLAMFVMEDLIQYGTVIRGWLGVSVQHMAALEPLTGNTRALTVMTVTPGSPAATAGVQANDIITGINGDSVVDGHSTMHRIALLRPGESVSIELTRAGEPLTVTAIIAARPTPDAS